MLTVDVISLEVARAHAANDLQRASLDYVAERFQAAEFIKRADGAFEFGRANCGVIVGMVTTSGGVTTNVGGAR